MKINHKKAITASIAVVAAVALTLGGTFAWQSISQTALNEKEAVINPGGRLHDDFNGTNKDVYVENFAENTIYARVRLDEYFEIVMNKGTNAETKTVVTEGATKDKTDTYITHKFDDDNATDGYWNWTTGGSTVYMPTFNKNKDSLKADINGTMDYTDAEDNAKPYGDYVEYTDGEEATADATYDNDSNNVEDDGVKTVEETHTAKETGTAKFISMAEWLELEDDIDNYWVYDTDGWVYWSSPISAGTATGLLLDEISLKGVMDDSYYYAINVVGQFITADDLGKNDNTGFYADGETVSDNALKLLKSIGVDIGDTTADDDVDDDLLEEGSVIYRAFIKSDKSTSSLKPYYDLVYFSTDDAVTEYYVANLVGVDGSDVCQVLPVETLSGINARLPSTAGPDYMRYSVSVKFLNKVKPTDTSNWFWGFGKEVNSTEIITMDFTNLDTSDVTDMSWMFYQCNAKTIDISGWDVSNVTDMGYMFYECDKLTELDLSSFDTSNVLDMGSMFYNCNNLTELDLSSFDTSNVLDMGSMFYNCNNLTELDLSSFDTSKVSDFGSMFSNCNSLKSLKIATFDTSSATDMRYMFYLCESLPELNIKSFDTSKVTDMEAMFGCLRSIKTLDVTNFDTSNVTNMSEMFRNCDILEDLDLSNFNISKVTDMELMFYSCDNLTLDCSGWDVSNVTAHNNFNDDAPGVTEPTWVN